MNNKKRRSIFRHEAIETQRSRHGQVVLIRPVAYNVITGFLLMLVVLAIAYLAYSSFTKSTPVLGVLKTPSGAKNIIAYQPGIIEEVFVKEGDAVLKNQQLYKIRTDKDGVDGSVNNQLVKSIKKSILLVKNKIDYQEELIRLESEEASNEITKLESEAKHVGEEQDLQKDYIKMLSSELSVVGKLFKSKQISQQDYNAKYAQVLEARINMKALSRKKDSLLDSAKIATSRRANTAVRGHSLIVGYQQNNEDLVRELNRAEANKFYIIKATTNGIVANLFFEEGHFIENNKPLMTILPKNSQLVAEIYIPSKAIGKVKEGQRISLRYHAFPFQKFGLQYGRIKKISKTLIEPHQAMVKSLLKEPSYRAIVTLESQSVDAIGKKVALQSGMQLNADILGETRTLLAWIFAPLLANNS